MLNEHFGEDLDTIEKSLVRIMEELFLDEDGFYRSEINARTLRPYQPEDSEILPPHLQWARRGLMPEEAKCIHMNYEDAGMTTGNYLQALIAKYRKTADAETRKLLGRTFEAISTLHHMTAESNEYGEGFLPKPYLGIRNVSRVFEMSADQWIKVGRSLDLYREVASPGEKARAEEILVSMARWLDDRDFVTPYMGGPVWGRIMQHEHYPAIFAYFMSVGHSINGDPHFLDEARSLLCRVLAKEGDIPAWEGDAEPDVNVQNLMTESLIPLMESFPDLKTSMVRRLNWWWENANACQLQEDFSSMHHSVNLNTASLTACTYVQLREFLDPGRQEIDVNEVLLSQNKMESFMVMKNPESCTVTGWIEAKNSLTAQMISAWLRAYWESR